MRIAITKDTITPELERLIRTAKNARPLFQAAGKATQVEISAHLRRLQARGNARGWPPQLFFAGKSTSVEKNVGIAYLSDKRVIVQIADPRFVHRIEGGTVIAKRKKNLAIPLTAEAYAASGKGSLVESMPGLKVIKLPRGVYLCREIEEPITRGATGGRKFNRIKVRRVIPLFKLVRSVTHRPHPEELPDAARLATAARNAMTTAAKLLFKSK